MSNQQRNDVRVVLVDREVADVVREQSLVTLEANHHYFEEVESFGADARRSLARIYREAFAVLDAIGWETTEAGESGDGDEVRIPLTPGHVEQLLTRRFELGHANIDRVEHTSDWTVADLAPGRAKGEALDRLFAAYGVWVAAA